MQVAGALSHGAPVEVEAGPLPVPAVLRDGLELLDDRDEWMEFSRLVGPQAGSATVRWESSVVFEGMHCAACAGTIEEALRAVPGVLEAEIGAASHRGRVVWDEGLTTPSAWMDAVRRTGYQPLPARNATAMAMRQVETRKMLWRLGVAGVCMMQVMMYAAPAYFTAPGEIDLNTMTLLRWAQWVLSIPVILFSCQPFFRNALRDLRLRRVSMDLPVALGMLITFVVSTLGTFEPEGLFGHEVYFDSLTMFVFFLLAGRWLELRLRDRTAGALEALMHRLPDSVERQDADGAWRRVVTRRLRVGDVIRVLPGESFPIDGSVLAGETAVDEALLTGESTPLARATGQPVIAGSHNLTGPIEIRVERVGKDTRFAQIVALMEQASSGRPQIAQLADRLAKPFLIGVLLAAGLACAWWWPDDPGRAMMIAVAILVVTCPCALSLATPAAMLASAGALARKGVLVRRLQALETLSTINQMVFDKTGTLTRDAFVLENVEVRPGVTRENALRLAAALARSSLHPVSRAVVDAALTEHIGQEGCGPADDVREWPGLGLTGRLGKGADATALRLGSAQFCGLAMVGGDRLVSHLADEQGWLASFGLREDVRADAAGTVKLFKSAGVSVRLLSGDRASAAARVGRQAGIDAAAGDCSPGDKLAAMRQAQRDGATVAMVGDGLNDGPVLAGADVSFAFGRAVPLAQAKADFVVMNDRLTSVVQTYGAARQTMRVVRQNLTWAVAYNAIGIPLAVLGWMPAWAAGLGMAASSLVVVLNALRLSTVQTPEVEG